MVCLDVKLDSNSKELSEWCKEINKKTKRVSSEIHINLLDPSKGYITLYSSYYIDEKTVFEDTIHEITEATIVLTLLREFYLKSDLYKVIADVSHLLADMSLYDVTGLIMITDVKKIFKNIDGYLKSLGYKYISPIIDEGGDKKI
jgi:hypothetical protein